MSSSLVRVEGMVLQDAKRNKDVTETSVQFDPQGHSVRIAASGPTGDNLSTFRRGHPIVITGELSCDTKGFFIAVRSIGVGRRA